MKIVTITRYETSDSGTFGRLECGDLTLDTLELPWRENKRKVSCIPAGQYTCCNYSSKKYPNVYEVQGVSGRSCILIHSGNYAGDKAKGLKSNVEGCILVGLSRGMLDGQMAVLNSRKAFKELREELRNSNFWLIIKNETGIGMEL